MTVRELIAVLGTFPPHTPVVCVTAAETYEEPHPCGGVEQRPIRYGVWSDIAPELRETQVISAGTPYVRL